MYRVKIKVVKSIMQSRANFISEETIFKIIFWIGFRNNYYANKQSEPNVGPFNNRFSSKKKNRYRFSSKSLLEER